MSIVCQATGDGLIFPSGAVASDEPHGLFAWFKNTTTLADTLHRIIGNYTAGSADDNSFYLGRTTAGNGRGATRDTTAANVTTGNTAADLTTWHLVTTSFIANNSRKVKMNAVASASDTSLRNPTAPNTTRIAINGNAAGRAYARLAMVGVVNRAITDAEHDLLYAGRHPLAVFGSALLSLVEGTNSAAPHYDIIKATNWTVNGSVPYNADNPTVDAAPSGATIPAGTYRPGDVVSVQGSRFASPMQSVTLQGGDVIAMDPGATATNATFTIPAISQFVAGGTAQHTQIGKPVTATVTNGATTAASSLTISLPVSGYAQATMAIAYAAMSAEAKTWIPAATIANDDILAVGASTVTVNGEVAVPSDNFTLTYRRFSLVSRLWSANLTNLFALATQPVIIEDEFTGSNGTLMEAHTPEVNIPGGPWATTVVSTGSVTPVVSIQNNRLSCSSVRGGADINAGTVNVQVEADWAIGAETNAAMHLHVRRQNADNYVGCFFDQAAKYVRIQTRVNGSLLTQAQSLPYDFTVNTIHTVKVLARQNNVGVYINGTLVVSADVPTLQGLSNTRVGLFAGAGFMPTQFTRMVVNQAPPPTAPQTFATNKAVYAPGEVMTAVISPSVEVPNLLTINGRAVALTTPVVNGFQATLPALSAFLGGAWADTPWFVPLNIVVGFPTEPDIVQTIQFAGPAPANVPNAAYFWGSAGDGSATVGEGASWYIRPLTGSIYAITDAITVVATAAGTAEFWAYNEATLLWAAQTQLTFGTGLAVPIPDVSLVSGFAIQPIELDKYFGFGSLYTVDQLPAGLTLELGVISGFAADIAAPFTTTVTAVNAGVQVTDSFVFSQSLAQVNAPSSLKIELLNAQTTILRNDPRIVAWLAKATAVDDDGVTPLAPVANNWNQTGTVGAGSYPVNFTATSTDGVNLLATRSIIIYNFGEMPAGGQPDTLLIGIGIGIGFSFSRLGV